MISITKGCEHLMPTGVTVSTLGPTKHVCVVTNLLDLGGILSDGCTVDSHTWL